jgi:hypothetical protein
MRHWQPSLAKPDASRLIVPNPARVPAIPDNSAGTPVSRSKSGQHIWCHDWLNGRAGSIQLVG